MSAAAREDDGALAGAMVRGRVVAVTTAETRSLKVNLMQPRLRHEGGDEGRPTAARFLLRSLLPLLLLLLPLSMSMLLLFAANDGASEPSTGDDDAVRCSWGSV